MPHCIAPTSIYFIFELNHVLLSIFSYAHMHFRTHSHAHKKFGRKVTKKNPNIKIFGLKNSFFLYFAIKIGKNLIFAAFWALNQTVSFPLSAGNNPATRFQSPPAGSGTAAHPHAPTADPSSLSSLPAAPQTALASLPSR